MTSGLGAARTQKQALAELARLFLRLGSTVFGGPAVHVAVMEDEVVRRRRWMTREEFLDLLGVANLLPGPNSTELAIHIGFTRAGWTGLVVAGGCFILPAVLLSGLLGWMYVRFGALPQAGWLLYGVKPVVLVIIAQAVWNLLPHAARNWPLRCVAALAAASVLLGVNEVAVLGAAGIANLMWTRVRSPRRQAPERGQWSLLLAAGAPATSVAATVSAVSLSSLFGVFAKAGALLFGSGYVLVAFLRADLVQRLGWLTETQLMDAIAVGQVTPGPLFSTATFIGYLLAGPTGAVVATAGIFLPAFLFIAGSGWLVPRLRSSPAAGAFLDGVNAASLSLMAAVAAQIARAAIVDPPALVLAAIAAIVLLRFKVSSTWIILGGVAAGGLVQWANAWMVG